MRLSVELGAYSDAEGQDNPADQAINDSVEPDIPFLHDCRDTQCHTAHNPAPQKSIEANAKKSDRFLPPGPVERIIDIIRRLRNKCDVGIFQIFKLMRICAHLALFLIMAGHCTIDELDSSFLRVDVP